MKSIKIFIFKSNKWFDNQPELLQSLYFFLYWIFGMVICLIVRSPYDLLVWFSWLMILYTWRLPYMFRKNKKKISNNVS